VSGNTRRIATADKLSLNPVHAEYWSLVVLPEVRIAPRGRGIGDAKGTEEEVCFVVNGFVLIRAGYLATNRFGMYAMAFLLSLYCD
jgi:hypothetical protein